jgi:hypothetical protein
MAPVILALFAPLAPAAVPPWIAAAEDETTDYPLWISIEEAAPNGYLRWELLPPSTFDRYRWMLGATAIEPESELSTDASDRDCKGWINVFADRRTEASSPRELLDLAGAVYLGRVMDSTPGFLNGELGTMIEVSVEEALKLPPSGEIPDRILVFYRFAIVHLADGSLCIGERRKANPKVGGTLILAPRKPEPTWPEHALFHVSDADIFFETERGEFSVAQWLEGLQLDAAAFVEALRAARAGEVSP